MLSTSSVKPSAARYPSRSIGVVSALATDVTGDLLAVALGEVGGDGDDLAQDVDVGCHGGHRSVEEQDVLHEEHQLLWQPCAVTEQGLGDLAEFGDHLVRGHGGRVDRWPVEPEVADHRRDVGVGR